MTWMGTRSTSYDSKSFRTLRKTIEEVKPGDMIYAAQNFIEVGSTQWMREEPSHGDNMDRLGLAIRLDARTSLDEVEPKMVLRIVVADRAGNVVVTGSKGDKVILLHDTHDEAQALLHSDAEYQKVREKYKKLIADMRLVGEDVWSDAESKGMNDKQAEAFVRITDAMVEDEDED